MQSASPPERDRSAILARYRSQHRAMVQRRTDLLAELRTDQFTAVHITGYEQPRRALPDLRAVLGWKRSRQP